MNMFKKINLQSGLSLVEMMVVISIIAVLSGIIYASFEDARKQARDKARMTALKELQLAVELYKAQNGTYPTNCNGGTNTTFYGPGPDSGAYEQCEGDYITGLVPDFIDELPEDPKSEDVPGQGFFYRTNGSSYKILVQNSVESITVTSGDEFYRCSGTCNTPGGEDLAHSYAVYSAGAEDW